MDSIWAIQSVVSVARYFRERDGHGFVEIAVRRMWEHGLSKVAPRAARLLLRCEINRQRNANNNNNNGRGINQVAQTLEEIESEKSIVREASV